jgi:hypothetical protein
MISDRFVCGGLFLICILATAGAMLPRPQLGAVLVIVAALLVIVAALLVVVALASAALAYLDGDFWDSLDEEDAE